MMRVGADWTFQVLMVDACTDCQPPDVARDVRDLVMDVLHNPEKERPEGEFFLGKQTKE